jgi:hypothetical protein
MSAAKRGCFLVIAIGLQFVKNARPVRRRYIPVA